MSMDVAIVGAGPYGLSLAAHLARTGVSFRIFGPPMAMWRERMPRAMHLKSEPFASNLYDPGGTFPLSRFCREQGIPYRDIGLPVSLETFCAYGMAFQQRFVPDLDPRLIVSVRQMKDGFELEIEGGETARFRRVVLAVGISHYAHTPAEFGHLPPERLSHSAADGELGRFAGQRVAVIGAGASAVDCATMLAEIGAEAHVVTRNEALWFHEPPRKRTLSDKLRRPMSTVGPDWKGVLCTRLPLVFHAMPEEFRLRVTRNFLGPAPCWFTREPFERSVTLHPRATGLTMQARGETVVLDMAGEGAGRTLEVDHVIAATGYRPDVRRLSFISPALLAALRTVRHTPILSSRFESSVPGLYFVGLSAANAFGPMLRFACGAGFSARRLSAHLARAARHSGQALSATPARRTRTPEHA